MPNLPICDICHKTCVPNDLRDNTKWNDNVEFATIKAHWGYCSRKDCEEHECIVCEGCYDKVEKFIESLGGEVRKYYYHMLTGDRLVNKKHPDAKSIYRNGL